MGQGSDAAFGSGVAFGAGLAHAVAARGDVHYRGTLGKVWQEKLSEVKGGGDADAKSLLELFVCTVPDSAHYGRGVVDEVIDVSVVGDDLFCESLKGSLVRDVADEIGVAGNVDGADGHAGLSEFVGDALADAMGGAGEDGDFISHVETP